MAAPIVFRPKWEIAALARAGGDSLRKAYEAAGFKYNAASAHRFFKRPEIVARITEIRKERIATETQARIVATEESGVDLAWTEKHYKYIVLQGLRGDPVRDSTGKARRDPETGAVIYKPDRYAAVKALDSLTRMKGGFIDRTEIGMPGDFTRMGNDELDRAIVETAKELGLPADGVKMLEHLTKREIVE